ncbi:pro-neuregulin-1, membrane-bound isoform-like isoform X2 [Haliotis rufescens]|uniref:pro-neuregulin-1, membrane-bound isoform-like isoform X2 n=1 Tax=Haliotis rufescens TaxID=6454 RepID=UPI001EB0A251|nr:pro-neuregulin-1, membrane-bound isoform-like isoform X2 [Haliotis rufescens]
MRRVLSRLITLGLLLCVVHVWSERTCGTEFTDTASSALLADIIVEGRVRRVPKGSDIYNVTVNVRKLKKGEKLLNGGKKPKSISIGPFGKENKQDCVGEVVGKKIYLFFLRKPNNGGKYLEISALPVKAKKRTSRAIQKIICEDCAKAPAIRKIRNRRIEEGETLRLKCSAKAKPNPKFQWFKDGHPLKEKSGTLRIQDKRRSSRLQIFKASERDEGNYVCLASNAKGSDNITVRVEVKAPTLKHRRCKQQTYCLNGGTCRYMDSLQKEFCECPEKWAGRRCEIQDIFSLGPDYNRQAKLLHDRTIIFISIAIATLVFIAICIVSYFMARRQRKKWEKRRDQKKKRNIPVENQYRPLLDDVDAPNPLVHRVKENHTQTDNYLNNDNSPPYSDPNIYPVINPYGVPNTHDDPPVEMRRQAQPLGAAPNPASNHGNEGPDRRSRASSRGSRTRLKAVSLDEGRDNEEEFDQPGMNEPDCIQMQKLPRNCYSDGNIKGGTRHAYRRPPPTMHDMDIPEGELDNIEPLNAEDPVVVDLESPALEPSTDNEDRHRPTDEPADDVEKPIDDQNHPKRYMYPPSKSLDFESESEEEPTEESPLTRLHISEDEEDQAPSRDKSFDSLDLDKSDSQPTVESVVLDSGPQDSRNSTEPLYKDNPDSLSSSVTGSPDTHPSSSMENFEFPILPNGTETGLSWDEHGMPVSPGHYAYSPPNTDSQNLEDQYIHPHPPNELPLSPTKNSAVYQKLLKDIREDQDPIPI